MKSYHYKKTIARCLVAYLILSFIILILGAACTSNSSSDATANLADLSGKYKLTGFTVNFDSGKTLKDEDVDFEGEMVIYESGHIEQDITINEKNSFIKGQIKIIDDSTMNMDSEDVQYKLGYDYDGKKLTTYLKDVSAFPYDEVDHWTKISEEP